MTTAQKATSPRKPGRPRGGKSNTANREQLLDIALNLFARQGVAPTSLNGIAREAGVTPAMMHYYFHSREQLLDAIVQERFMPIRERMTAHFTAHADNPVQAFSSMVRELVNQSAQHQWFAPLWLQEISGEIPVLRAHMAASAGDDKYQALMAKIKAWQDAGKLNAALAPELLITSILSLVLVPVARMQHDERFRHLDSDVVLTHALAILNCGIGG